MLKFIGTGSAFNTKLGNNSAYMKIGNKLFLIDCGSSTFSKIIEMKLLDGVDEIYVLVTHTHPDHVGSLGDLIFYSYYSLGVMGEKCLTVLSPIGVNVNTTLRTLGVEPSLYSMISINGLSNIGNFENSNLLINTIKVKHVNELSCYGYEIYYKSKIIYYSGDCYEIPEDILTKINANVYHAVYQDTCIADYDGNVHLSLKKLNQLVTNENSVRENIYCMHLDNNFDCDMALAMGFKIAK